MHLKAKPPIFMPLAYRAEIEKLSKAALMDLAWDFATTSTDGPGSPSSIMDTLRKRAEVIQFHRKAASGE